MGIAPAIAAITSLASVNEARKSRKDAEKERDRQKAEQLDTDRKEAEKVASAKRQEYSKTRSSMQRAGRRGRASTLLDSKGTLG